jgi:hypothetical protein
VVPTKNSADAWKSFAWAALGVVTLAVGSAFASMRSR